MQQVRNSHDILETSTQTLGTSIHTLETGIQLDHQLSQKLIGTFSTTPQTTIQTLATKLYKKFAFFIKRIIF